MVVFFFFKLVRMLLFKLYLYGIIRMFQCLLSFFAVICLKLHSEISDFVL